MTEVIAKLKYYKTTPRKVRLVADLVRGKKINEAMAQLEFSKKKSSGDIIKLLKSALSNAKNNYKIDTGKTDLYIKEIRVDEGPALRRYRPVWRGMAHPFKRKSSHITVVLSEKLKVKGKRK